MPSPRQDVAEFRRQAEMVLLGGACAPVRLRTPLRGWLRRSA